MRVKRMILVASTLVGAFMFAGSALASPAASNRAEWRGWCGGPAATGPQMLQNLKQYGIRAQLESYYGIDNINTTLEAFFADVQMATLSRTMVQTDNKGCNPGSFFDAKNRVKMPGDKMAVRGRALRAKFPDGYSLVPKPGWRRVEVPLNTLGQANCSNPGRGKGWFWVWVKPVAKKTPPTLKPGPKPKPKPPVVKPPVVPVSVVCTGLKVQMTGATSVSAEVSLSRSDVPVRVVFQTRPEGGSTPLVPLVPTGSGQAGSVRQDLDWRQLGGFELAVLINGVVQGDNCKTVVRFGGGPTSTPTPVTPPVVIVTPIVTPPATCPAGTVGAPPICFPPPTVRLTLPGPGHGFTVNGSGQICATVGLPVGHGVTVVFTATGTTSTPYQVDNQTWCVWYTAPATAGTETMSVRVTDTNTGLSASDSGQFMIASYGF